MAYGIQNLSQASQAPRRDVQRLSSMGMRGDDTVGHLTSGEMVLPKSAQTPGIMSLIAGQMRQQGVNPSEFIVGSSAAQGNANPYTGAQQFGEEDDSDTGGGSSAAGSQSDSQRSENEGGYSGGGNRDGGDPMTERQLAKHFGFKGSGWSANNPDGIMARLGSLLGFNNYSSQFGEADISAWNPGGILGGIGGLLAGPQGAMAGSAAGTRLAEAAGWRPDTGFSWGTDASTPTSPSNGMEGGQPGSNTGPGFGERNYDGRSIGDLIDRYSGNLGGGQQPVTAPGTIGEAVPMPSVAGAPDYANTDWAHYGEQGGEMLMYPWQTPDGGTSYGQYEFGQQDQGAAPRQSGPNRGPNRRGNKNSIEDLLASYGTQLGYR